MTSPSAASRRLFLRGGAALVGGAATLSSAPALAFRLVAEEDLGLDIPAACVEDTARTHDALLAEVKEKLGVDLDEEEVRRILSEMSCPLCGCNLRSAVLESRGAGF